MDHHNTSEQPTYGQKKIWRAGLIPYFINDKGAIEMMFMVPSDQTYGGSSPQIAKGRIEDGEDPKETAIREAKEELGLIPANIMGDVEFLGVHLGRTHMFTCRVDSKDLFGVFSFETDDVVWMTEDEFRQNGRDIHRDVVHLVESHAITRNLDVIREIKQSL